MARRPRTSIDYFPVSTNWDLKMRLVLQNFGLEGIGAVIQLEQMIFNEGYACTWNEESEYLFMAENHVSKEKLEMIMKYCLEHDIFNRRILNERKMLTSRNIQLEWLKICEICRRKNCEIALELDLTSENLENETGLLGNNHERHQNNTSNLKELSGKILSDSEEISNGSEKLGVSTESFSQRERREKEIKEIEAHGKNTASITWKSKERQLAERTRTFIEELAKWKKVNK